MTLTTRSTERLTQEAELCPAAARRIEAASADATLVSDYGGERRMPKLIIFVSEDWYFWSHRLPLAVAAKEAGYEVVVITRVSSYGHAIREHGFALIPIRMTRRTLSPLRELSALREIIGIYSRLQPDVVHHVAIKPVLYGSIAARIAGVSGVVNALTGLGWLFSDSKGGPAALRALVSAAFRVLLKRGEVLVQNPDDLKTIAGFGIDDGAISVIKGAGVELDRFVPSEEPAGIPIVLLASRMLWCKGVQEFVDAARLLKDAGVRARFVLVGTPDEENPSAVPEQTLRDWNDQGVVEWWGRSDDMPQIFAQANAVCLPSFYREGVPKVLIEAAACARPIVTTDTPGCREVVRDRENGLLVPPRDVPALADAIGQLIAHPEDRKRMGALGRQIAEAEFSVETVVDSTLAIYQKVRNR